MELISIHALREEGDSARVNVRCVYYIFQSTPSARRATGSSKDIKSNNKISIHALREEGDRLLLRIWRWIWYFNPRPPRGGRQA